MHYIKIIFISSFLLTSFFDVQTACHYNTKNALQVSPHKVAHMQAAIKAGNISLVQKLIEARYPLDAADKEGKTALHHAVSVPNSEIARYLVAAGAQVNVQDPWGITPLMDYVFEGNAVAVRILLSLGADKTVKNEDGKQAADYAHDLPKTLARENILAALSA